MNVLDPQLLVDQQADRQEQADGLFPQQLGQILRRAIGGLARLGRRRKPRFGLKQQLWVAPASAVQPGFLVHDLEQRLLMEHALGAAQKQVAARSQTILKYRQDAHLQFAAKIDQHVAATDQIQPQKRWVLRQVLPGENHQFP